MSESDEGTPRPRRSYEESVSGEMVSRTAAHESGHVLPAWLSWAVASVEGTVFVRDDKELRIEFRRTFREPLHPTQLWEALVISSGGMAGEVVTHVTFRTRNSSHDILGMKEQMVQIMEYFGAAAKPPWPEPCAHKAPPFETYFPEGLPDGWGDIMRSAYRRAKDLILLHRGAFERLRTAMLVKIELTTAEIAAALRMPKA